MGSLEFRHVVFAVVLASSVAAAGRADTLVLKNGSTFEVRSAHLEGDVWVVVGPAGRERRIPATRVAEVKPSGVAPASTPAATPSASVPSGPKVFTNTDLPNGGSGDGSTTGARGKRISGRSDAETGRELDVQDKKWEVWRNRYERAQARVDAAQKKLDDLEAKSDAVSGDVKTTSEGAKITGMRPGSGYGFASDAARRELTNAQAALDHLREEAEVAGVPPGVLR